MSTMAQILLSRGLPATFNIEQFLTNATTKAKDWGGLFIILVGAIMMIVAIYKMAKGFILHGKTQTSWGICIAMLLIGGALVSFAVGKDAWAWVQGIAEGGKQTIEDLGTNPTIIHGLRLR